MNPTGSVARLLLRGKPLLAAVVHRAISGWNWLLPRAERCQDWLADRFAPALAWAEAAGPRRTFVVIVAAFLLFILLWAAVMPVDVIVRAEGRIIPAGKAQIIQHLEGGIVSAILVSEGQAVAAEQPLMELSDIRARSDLGQERSHLDSLRGKESRLEAESLGNNGVAFPEELRDRDIRKTETDAFVARRARLAEELKVLRNQGEQKRGELREAETRRTNQASELEVARRQASVLDGLRAKGAASQLEVLDSQSRVQRLMSQLSESEASLPRIRASVAEIESRIQEVGARFRAEATAELAQVRADIEKVRHEIDAGADRLDRSVVKSPVTGYVNKLNVNTVGGVVRPGDNLLEITPTDNRIVLEGKVKPNDRASLRSGLPARVRIGAFDYATYGVLEGRVTEVSADTIVDDRGERFYRVRIDAPTSHDFVPLPGMTAQADVIVGRRTILSYVLSPVLRFRDSAFRDPR